MPSHKCNLIVNHSKKELQSHGLPEFPCAYYESSHTSSIEDTVPWHWHQDIEIIYIKKGTLTLQVPCHHMSINQGELVVINAHTLHCIFGSPYCEIQSIVFSPLLITGNNHFSFATKYLSPLLSCSAFSSTILNGKDYDTPQHFALAINALKTNTFAYEFIVREHLTTILLTVYKLMQDSILLQTQSVNIDTIRFEKMLDYIHQNFSESITLSDIAKVSDISERECLRCFKRNISESPIQYLLKYRLLQSAHLLLSSPTENISTISSKCGFDSSSYFSKCFKRLYHCTPKEYTKKNT